MIGGTVSGAAMGAISYAIGAQIKGEDWSTSQCIASAILGAADGYMAAGIAAGVSGIVNVVRTSASTVKISKGNEVLNVEDDLVRSAGKSGTPSSFRTQELLDSHFAKHGTEFGNITKEQYIQGANNLINSSGDNILTKIRTNGDTLFYNVNTNEFAVKSADGFIRTYFKPTKGIDYFMKQ